MQLAEEVVILTAGLEKDLLQVVKAFTRGRGFGTISNDFHVILGHSNQHSILAIKAIPVQEGAESDDFIQW